ncbi:PilW family protein [Vandammella animalimorsus]|uniref:Prepilin-type cleavage/methylation domain-containing protein n=1 Tax=Vandammella animalimorsus TaxID=2029117 RepID=A0A2A2AWW3_9BURK|nr:PilW family protein [Vandammella animalimorsus]PAT42316.1 prepilin-type cleavage/methylation domain-containing protein [Vandammella animalimorsus]
MLRNFAYIPKTRNSSHRVAGLERQNGVTLVELMVGIVIGMLVVAVAVAAVLASRGATTTVSEAAQLQQQASYAFRVLGQQIRQAGSLELNLDSEGNQGTSNALSANSKVAFLVDYSQWGEIVNGVDTPNNTQFALGVGYQNYAERLVDNSIVSQFRDCLGAGGAAAGAVPPRVINQFSVRNGSLVCSGIAGQAQDIIRNVADFQVRYYVQGGAATGNPTIMRVQASGVTNWADVVAVEVCLDMVGSNTVGVPATSQYRNCQDVNAPYNNRIHHVYRNVFQLRSQGVLG